MAEIFPFKSQLIELITLHSRKLSSQPNEEERNKCQQDILALLKATTDELNQKKGQIDKKDSVRMRKNVFFIQN